VDMAALPLDDADAYDLLSAGDTTGVFQLESSGMREILMKLKPNLFEDIIALVALYRPGPLKSGMVDDFIKGKHGEIEVSYPLPQLKSILQETYGVILYQEQVMQIASKLANYSLGEADLLRRAMGKKIEEEMDKQRSRFMAGAGENRLDPDKANHVFDLMANFAGYGFNKSHSAAYALIAYQTAYLKAKYPVEFWAALLSSEMSNQDKIVRFIAECRERGIPVLPPDINESRIDFTVVNGEIRFGLAAIKGVGQSAIESILEVRSEKRFTDLFDFCERVDLRRVNRRVIEALIKCGAFDSTGADRAKMIAAMDDALERGARLQREKEQGQTNLFAAFDETGDDLPIRWPDVSEWRESDRLAYEKESLGFYISGHPLDRYARELAALTNTDTEKIKDLPVKSAVRVGGVVAAVQVKPTKKGTRMAFLTLEDMKGLVEVLVFSDLFETCQELLESDRPLLVSGEIIVDEKGGSTFNKIKGQEIVPLDGALEKMARFVVFEISTASTDRPALLRLKRIIESHRGETPVVIKFCVPGCGQAVLKLKKGVRATRSMIREARETLGESGVTLRYD
jgi:DNA polymerase III subunit alpha